LNQLTNPVLGQRLSVGTPVSSLKTKNEINTPRDSSIRSKSRKVYMGEKSLGSHIDKYEKIHNDKYPVINITGSEVEF
jgi:hypothetical protein